MSSTSGRSVFEFARGGGQVRDSDPTDRTRFRSGVCKSGAHLQQGKSQTVPGIQRS
jgi:hypothetical protein